MEATLTSEDEYQSQSINENSKFGPLDTRVELTPKRSVVRVKVGRRMRSILAYLASIVASMLMFDAATKFKLRILAPVLVSLLILLVAFEVWLRNKRRAVVIVLTLLLLGVSVYKQSVTIDNWAKHGLGYASFQWYDSKAMAFLRKLPELTTSQYQALVKSAPKTHDEMMQEKEK